METKIKKKIDEIIRNRRIADLPIQKTCQYLVKDGDRFCKATSQETCSRCKFYDPVYSAKISIMAEAYMSLERMISRKDEELSKQNYTINMLNKAVTFYKTCGTGH